MASISSISSLSLAKLIKQFRHDMLHREAFLRNDGIMPGNLCEWNCLSIDLNLMCGSMLVLLYALRAAHLEAWKRHSLLRSNCAFGISELAWLQSKTMRFQRHGFIPKAIVARFPTPHVDLQHNTRPLWPNPSMQRPLGPQHPPCLLPGTVSSCTETTQRTNLSVFFQVHKCNQR